MDLTTIAILSFLTGFLLILGISSLFAKTGSQVSKRLKNLEGGEKAKPMAKKEEKGDLLRKTLAAFGKIRLMERLGRRMDQQLEESDVPLSGGEFMAIVVGIILLVFLLMTMITGNPAAGMAVGAIAGYVPFFLVTRSRNQRLTSFNGQICDALSIMSNALRAGFSFMQSMDMVRQEMPDPISKEFSRTFREVNLGTSTEQALYNLGNRINSDDLNLVITAVQIQRQVGGNLSEVLDQIASTIRERVRIQGEIRTLTAQGRLSGMVIGALPLLLGVAMLVINPTYVSLLVTENLGRMMLLMAVLGEIVGFMFIQKIVKIKV